MIINGFQVNLTDRLINLLDNYNENIYPSKDNIFRALTLTSFSDVKVVFIGQDPYPNKHDACGLAFSVNRSSNLPASLKNIFKALEIDLGISRSNGDLSDWASQGVLLLNSILTFNSENPTSHLNIGWEEVTRQIVRDLSKRGKVIFVLLGKYAQSLEEIIVSENNTIICAPHPSPLSAYRGFFDAHIFTEIEKSLQKYGYGSLKW